MAVDTTFEGLPYFTAVWTFVAATPDYSNHTIEAQTPAGTSFTWFGTTSDYVYLGHQSKFDLFTAIEATAGVLGALTYEYYDNNSNWVQFVPRRTYDFTASGAEEWNIRQLVGWTSFVITTSAPDTADSVPDSIERYYIRISAASVSSAPTINQVQARPYAYYCTATDVFHILQLDADFSSSTVPTRDTVEDAINAAQSIIEFRTYKAWRPVIKEDEHYEFSIAGIKLIERDIQRVLTLEVWDGGSWSERTQGRDQDYFILPDMGMLYFSRFFLLPARMASYNAPVWRWGWAEFTFPVRITYIYGRNKFTDTRQYMNIWDITRKLAAIDVYQSHDYSVLAASGSDKVSLDRKIENWKQEVEEQLEELRRWIIL